MLSQQDAVNRVAAMAALASKGDSDGAGMLLYEVLEKSDNRPQDMTLMVSMAIGLSVHVAQQCGLDSSYFSDMLLEQGNLDE